MQHLKANRLQLALALSLLTLSFTLMARPDYAREQRWADEVVPGLLVGEAVYLTQPNKHQFLGIYAQTDRKPTAVIVVHGMGLHPDWGMIGTLRQRLFDDGYSTLSIQMPVLAAEAEYTAYPPLFVDAAQRLQIAVDYIKQQKHHCIAIVSHSNGSRMSRGYMEKNPPQVSAWVAISLTQGDTYANIKTPVLDLYGENDLPHVLSANAKRKQSLLNPASKQQSIADADHFFSGHEDLMVAAVKQFLDNEACKQHM